MASPIFNMTLKAAKAGFFDRNDPVQKAVDRAASRQLSKWGAFVRTDAISSMLRHAVRKGFGVKSKVSSREGVSAPGQPPFPHTGALVKNISFWNDRKAKTVIVGPNRLNQVTHRGPRFFSRTIATEVLEYGGIISIFEIDLGGNYWVRADLRSRRRIAEHPQRWRTVRIAPRPYMRPAAARQDAKLSVLWANSVTKAA